MASWSKADLERALTHLRGLSAQRKLGIAFGLVVIGVASAWSLPGWRMLWAQRRLTLPLIAFGLIYVASRTWKSRGEEKRQLLVIEALLEQDGPRLSLAQIQSALGPQTTPERLSSFLHGLVQRGVLEPVSDGAQIFYQAPAT